MPNIKSCSHIQMCSQAHQYVDKGVKQLGNAKYKNVFSYENVFSYTNVFSGASIRGQRSEAARKCQTIPKKCSQGLMPIHTCACAERVTERARACRVCLLRMVSSVCSDCVCLCLSVCLSVCLSLVCLSVVCVCVCQSATS